MISRPPKHLRIRTFTRKINTSRGFRITATRRNLSLQLYSLNPNPKINIMSFATPAKMTTRSTMTYHSRSFTSMIRNINMLNRSGRQQMYIRYLNRIDGRLTNLTIFTNSTIRILRRQLRFNSLITRSINPNIRHLQLRR